MEIFTSSKKGPSILSMTDANTQHTVTAVLQEVEDQIKDIVGTLSTNWFNQFGIPKEIYFKKGKVETSRLSQAINQQAGLIPNNARNAEAKTKPCTLKSKHNGKNTKIK